MVKLTKIGWEIFYTSNKQSEKDLIEKSLKYFNENSHFSNSEYWDGYVKYYDKRRKCFNFGHLSYIINKLNNKNIQYEIYGIDLEIFQPKISYNKKLHLHQLAALYSFFDTKHGVIKVPTRGGKTYIASEAIRLILDYHNDYKVLFLVDSQMLFNQAIEDISDYLNISKNDIGYIKEGKIVIKSINIATIQSLQSIYYGVKRIRKTKKVNKVTINKTSQEIRDEKKQKNLIKKELIDFLKSLKFLIVDECHEYSSDERMKIIKETSNSEFNLFLSATPYKSENKFANLTLRGIFSDILYEIPEQELKNRGVLAKDKIVLLKIDHEKNRYINFNNLSGYSDYMDKLIINNKERNQISINIIEICRKLKYKTLALFSFKDHGYNISKITSDPFITSDNKISDRILLKDVFLKEDGGVLMASNIFNKGLTLPEVEIMFNIGGGKEQSSLIQKKGRVLGTTNDKKRALIIDFLDESEYFAEHSLSRLEVYEKSVGIDNIVVFDVYDEDLYTEFFRQVSLNKNFVYKPKNHGLLKEQLIICRFIKWLNKEYNQQVDINFLIDYFKFQFSHYSGVNTQYGKNVIMLHWIIGQKAIDRWKNRDVRKKWLVRVKLKNEVELKLTQTYNNINKKRKQNKFKDIYKYEENDKRRFHNTEKGFQYCLYTTTLYNPLSKLCESCKFNIDCRDILNVNHPKLYKERIDE